MILTNDQQQALSSFKDFLKSDKAVFILRGAAGTGKTTILKEFIKTITADRLQFSLVAPTGRAALILTKRTHYSASTIHRLIYSITEHPKNVEDRYIFELKENKDTINHIYFVDEASMVSDKFSDNEMYMFGSGRLLNDLFSYCNIVGLNRKIVFIGDHAQLPPVGQSISPALDESYMNDNYNVKPTSVTLFEVVRQAADSGINQNAQKIRASIENNIFNKFTIADSSNVFKLEIANFIDKYAEVAKSSSIEDCIVIADSNSKALEYNGIIRQRRYGSKGMPIRANDLLLITRNNYSKEVELFNGTIVKVVYVDDYVDTQSAFVGKERYTLHFRRITIAAEEHQISCLILEDFLTDRDGALSFKTQKALWSHFACRMQNDGISCNSTEFDIRMSTDEYLNALQCKYGYAITCHKAQGGEWQNVFADIDKVGGKSNETYFRWVYTAITRAKDKLFHISSPSFKESDFIEFGTIEQCTDKSLSYYIPQSDDFQNYYFNILKVQCENIGISCIDDRSTQYQHRIKFSRYTDNASCKLSLWYSKRGYNRKIDVISSSDDTMKGEIINLIKIISPIEQIPFDGKFEQQIEMNEILRSCAKECGYYLTDIEQKEWSDVYYFVTIDDICFIELYYNSKGRYTKIQPRSSATNNENSNNFIETFKSKIYEI